MSEANPSIVRLTRVERGLKGGEAVVLEHVQQGLSMGEGVSSAGMFDNE